MTKANENLTEKIISCHSPFHSLGEKLQPHSIQRIIRCFISSFILKESCLVENNSKRTLHSGFFAGGGGVEVLQLFFLLL